MHRLKKGEQMVDAERHQSIGFEQVKQFLFEIKIQQNKREVLGQEKIFVRKP